MRYCAATSKACTGAGDSVEEDLVGYALPYRCRAKKCICTTEPLTCGDRRYPRTGHDHDVPPRVLYLIFDLLLSWLTLLGRAASSEGIELLVLRLEVAVLRGTNPRPSLHWTGRAPFAAVIRRLPTLLRGHRPGHIGHVVGIAD
jgi:hypothetical protein